jgi:hypothetical protein
MDDADGADKEGETPLRDELGKLLSVAKNTAVLRLCGTGAGFVGTAVVGFLGSEELAAAAYAQAIITLSQVNSDFAESTLWWLVTSLNVIVAAAAAVMVAMVVFVIISYR